MARTILLFASLFFVALTSGAAFVVWLVYNPAGMPVASYVAWMQHGIHALAPLGVTVNLAWLLTLISAILARRDRGAFKFLIAASACLIVAAAITIVVNWPINGQIVAWAISAPPPNWTDLRDEWWRAHIARTILSIAALALAIVAALNRREPAVDASAHAFDGR